MRNKILCGIQMLSSLLMLAFVKHVDIHIFLVYIAILVIKTAAQRSPQKSY